MATIRRADIDLERKGAMLILASYANYTDDPDTGRTSGEGIHPGTDRYAQDLRKSLATARRYLAWARDIGIIELTRRANRRRGLCDEYRLILSVEAMERLGVPDPTEYRGLIANAAQARRDTAKSARVRRSDDSPEGNHQRSAMVSAKPRADDHEPQDDQRSAKVSAKTAISAQTEAGLALSHGERPPYMNTPSISLTEHDADDLRTELTVTRARPPSQDPSIHEEEETTDHHHAPRKPGDDIHPTSQPKTTHDPRKTGDDTRRRPCGNPLCRDGVIRLGLNHIPCRDCAKETPCSTRH